MKILLNAESFGFGPTAAIASFFPYLKEIDNVILGYIGKSHTLDLQKTLPYKEIYDITLLDRHTQELKLREVIRNYDIVFTALDFHVANIAKEEAKFVAIYDPLTWYWQQIPQIIRECDIYFAQDFINVHEKVQRENLQANTEIVPPIINSSVKVQNPHVILLNLGGLLNPLWQNDQALNYAQTIITTVKKNLTTKNLIITTSTHLARQLGDPSIQTLPRESMLSLLPQVKFALMTPGLGNIFDAAAFDIPTIWLPPANDSQGQQVELLKQNNFIDAFIDWPEVKIDFFKEQEKVLEIIAYSIYLLSTNKYQQIQIDQEITTLIKKISNSKHSKTQALLTHFGSGGDKILVDSLYNKLSSRFNF